MKLAEVLREGSPFDLLSSNDLAVSITTSPRFKCVIAKMARLLYFLPEGAILFLWALSSSQFEKCSRITEVASNNFGFNILIKGEILVRKPLKPIEKTRTKQ